MKSFDGRRPAVVSWWPDAGSERTAPDVFDPGDYRDIVDEYLAEDSDWGRHD